MVSADERFLFDVAGFLHLRQALTVEELARYDGWIREAQGTDVRALNAGNAEALKNQLNRPVSRIIDADPRFACFLDHPVVAPYLEEFLGEDYRHIDNDLYFTSPGYKGGVWHRGIKSRPEGHVRHGIFTCPMVKVFYCMTDVGPGEGEFVIVPGSHRAHFDFAMDRVDLPGQHVFNNVRRGDIIIFDEGLLHNGRPNPSQTTRQTIIMNFGRRSAGVWKGYQPAAKTLAAVSVRQRAILTNESPVWAEPG